MRVEQVDVLVVGAGPAGLATAIAVRECGIGRVVVLDREEHVGGIPRHSDHNGYGMRDLHRLYTGPRYARHYEQLARAAGVRIRTRTSATGWTGPTSLASTSPAGLVEWRAGAVVLATGCRERPRSARLVPGTRPAGVFTTGTLQQLCHLYRQRAGDRAVVVGAEHVSFSAVHTLLRSGSSVAAVLTDAPRHHTYAPLKLLTADLRGVPVRTGTRLVEILGAPRVTGVRVADACGRETLLPCDTVVFTGDWIPDHELARTAGVELDPGTRGPAVDQRLRTLAPGVFAVGNLVHAAETADVAALDGRHAAAAVCAHLGGAPWPRRVPIRAVPPLRWVAPNTVAPGDGGPARGVLLARVAEAVRAGRIRVLQGDRVLHDQPVRRLVPDRGVTVGAAWFARVEPDGGPIDVRCDRAR